MPTPDLTIPPAAPLSQASATTPRINPMPLAAALAALDPANDTHWDADGKPNTTAVSDMVGSIVTRADIDAVAPTLKRPTPPTGSRDRLAALEDDLAYLRALFGWPTKDKA